LVESDGGDAIGIEIAEGAEFRLENGVIAEIDGESRAWSGILRSAAIGDLEGEGS